MPSALSSTSDNSASGSSPNHSNISNNNSPQVGGAIAAFGAFFIWGFLPLYFNIIGSQVLPWEILIHRALWAVPMLACYVLFTHRGPQLLRVLTNWRILATLFVTACLITTNWGVFIWAVTHGHIIESSLGYYINPLLNVLLGYIILKERLRPLQMVAVVIAACGVIIMVAGFGHVPWIALILAVTFGSYGLIRKQAPVDNVTGLFVETLMLAPAAAIWLALLYQHNEAAFGMINWQTNALLIGCGLITIVPLILFVGGAKSLRFGTLGLIQYVTPTLQFLTGVFIYHEAFTQADAITFGFIWVGLMLYTVDTLRAQRHSPAV